MTDYIASSDFKADYPNSEFGFSSTDYDDSIASLITDASRLIDKEVGKWDNYFSPSSDATTRYYDGTGTLVLYVDAITASTDITTVAVSQSGGLASSDYTTWSSSDYIIDPLQLQPLFTN